MGPLDEFALSDISGLPRLRRDFGLFEPPRQQGRPRTVACGVAHGLRHPAPAICASLDLAQDIVTYSRVAPNARKTATSSGECGLIRIGLQHAPLAQPVHLRIGQPEMAEDLGILQAELRGDSAHLHALADLDRDADVWDLAQLRVARLLNEAAVADLRVGERLRVIIDRAAGHTGGFEHLDPVLGGLGRHHRIHHVL